MLILFSQHFISVHVNVGCLANDDRGEALIPWSRYYYILRHAVYL